MHIIACGCVKENHHYQQGNQSFECDSVWKHEWQKCSLLSIPKANLYIQGLEAQLLWKWRLLFLSKHTILSMYLQYSTELNNICCRQIFLLQSFEGRNGRAIISHDIPTPNVLSGQKGLAGFCSAWKHIIPVWPERTMRQEIQRSILCMMMPLQYDWENPLPPYSQCQWSFLPLSNPLVTSLQPPTTVTV